MGDGLTPHSLTIVIPALNEEDAIGGTIARCLAARERIKEAAGLSYVEIVVVSDGSTDRTAQIAKSYEDVKVIVFEKNRGYGAAIKEGWRQGSGSLVLVQREMETSIRRRPSIHQQHTWSLCRCCGDHT